MTGDRESAPRVACVGSYIFDSTGCGDAFCAGVIPGLTLGRSLEEAAWPGIASGTLTAGGPGSAAGLRDRDSTPAFLDDHRPRRVEQS